MNVVLFGLDIEDPLCGSILDALLTAGAAQGVRLKWGSVSGTNLTVVMDGNVDQGDILKILESKMRSKEASSPQTTRQIADEASGVLVSSANFFESF